MEIARFPMSFLLQNYYKLAQFSIKTRIMPFRLTKRKFLLKRNIRQVVFREVILFPRYIIVVSSLLFLIKKLLL